MAFPGKVMADSETQKLERKDFFQRIVEKVATLDPAKEPQIIRLPPPCLTVVVTH